MWIRRTEISTNMSTVELKTRGEICNLSCPYCYEQPMRDAGNFTSGYDLDAMKAALTRENKSFTFFGGEPLLTPRADLEHLAQWGFEKFGGTSLQTNGSLIEPWHIDLFARCNVSVGVSVDGPDELNDSRWAGSLEKTRTMTARSHQAIQLLIAAKRTPGLIVTLSRVNASPERLPRLLQWFRELDAAGVISVNVHLLEVEHRDVRGFSLTQDENIAAMMALYDLQGTLKGLRFDTFGEVARLLTSAQANGCVWGGCDPLTTPAVHGVDATGQQTNCGRTNKDGVDWTKADGWAPTRTALLYSTPQDDGGCQDCRFFFACRGQCPGTAFAGDWRNRSEHCETWIAIFERVESDLASGGIVPLSWPTRSAERLALEAQQVAGAGGEQEHADHWDAPNGYQHADGVIFVHGDQGNTEMHGDSTNPPGNPNGFSSEIEMDRAHKMIMDALGDVRGLEVIDFGAGDGALLQKLKRKGAVFAVGIEHDAAKVAAGIACGVDLRHGAITDYEPRESFGIGLISERRFEEMSAEQQVFFREKIRPFVAELLVYSYDEPRFTRRDRP
jgi:uncharacterized protein